jgi:competence protein ComEC
MKNIITILKIGKEFFAKNAVNITSLVAALCVFISKGELQTGPEIIFFDVGQGDAILIQQNDFQILVDGGPDDTIIYHLARNMPRGDKTIEIVVLTHPHEDHLRGLMNVLDEFNVEKIFLNKIEYENRGYHYLLEKYEDIIVSVVEGDTFQYADIAGTVIYPPEDKTSQSRNINDESVVMLVEVLDYRVLLMGDAEVAVERDLLKTHNLGNIYVLKAGHHCSKTATSEMFLREIKPHIAICSSGEGNKFGHPDYETIEKFGKHNVQYFITYKVGSVVIKFGDL